MRNSTCGLLVACMYVFVSTACGKVTFAPPRDAGVDDDVPTAPDVPQMPDIPEVPDVPMGPEGCLPTGEPTYPDGYASDEPWPFERTVTVYQEKIGEHTQGYCTANACHGADNPPFIPNNPAADNVEDAIDGERGIWEYIRESTIPNPQDVSSADGRLYAHVEGAAGATEAALDSGATFALFDLAWLRALQVEASRCHLTDWVAAWDEGDVCDDEPSQDVDAGEMPGPLDCYCPLPEVMASSSCN